MRLQAYADRAGKYGDVIGIDIFDFAVFLFSRKDGILPLTVPVYMVTAQKVLAKITPSHVAWYLLAKRWAKHSAFRFSLNTAIAKNMK